MQNVFIVIPALNPDDKLIKLIQELNQNDFINIIVINDGSKKETLHFFKEAESLNAMVLNHYINLGKGQALKTAFNYILNEYGENVVIVCADADGQHTVNDIISLKEKAFLNKDALILGCRQFDDKAIPFRSRFGNKLTRKVFSYLCAVYVSDTQTGLRAMSGQVAKKFLTTKGERFEYEMNMLIETKEKEIPIIEEKISTIYLEKNETSHFNPIKDSLRIYRIFLKFMLSSSLACIVDLALFEIFRNIFIGFLFDPLYIWLSTFIARVFSSFINYTVNKNNVFNIKEKKTSTLVKYYILCTVQMSCSALLVGIFKNFIPIGATPVKLLVDLVLFIISFQIQREWVFKKNKKQISLKQVKEKLV